MCGAAQRPADAGLVYPLRQLGRGVLEVQEFWSRAARALAVRAVRSAVFAHDMWAAIWACSRLSVGVFFAISGNLHGAAPVKAAQTASGLMRVPWVRPAG